MKRRTVLKALPTLAILPAALKINIVDASEPSSAKSATAAASGSKKAKVPDYAGAMHRLHCKNHRSV